MSWWDKADAWVLWLVNCCKMTSVIVLIKIYREYDMFAQKNNVSVIQVRALRGMAIYPYICV